jgi:glycine C-acetyltransferase
VRREPERIQRLHDNTRYLRARLEANDFSAIGETNVVPVILPPELNPKQYARELLDYGLWVSPIWFIAKPRIRITVNAIHTREEIDRLVAAMVKARDLVYKQTISA